jgi:hypothetical protein
MHKPYDRQYGMESKFFLYMKMAAFWDIAPSSGPNDGSSTHF